MTITHALTALADGIEARQDDPQVLARLAQARAACRPTAGDAQLVTVLEAWQQVWPRLGAQREFRLAVAREARLWAKRAAAASAPAEP